MKLIPLMTMYAELKEPISVGQGPNGDRMIYDVTGGHFKGDRLSGKVVASGGDWIINDEDGVGHLDVRATLLTDDGAYIYVQYYGVLVLNETVVASLEKGETVNFGDMHFVTQPRFETGDERYKWLNQTMAVAQGRPLTNAVEYNMYEVVND